MSDQPLTLAVLTTALAQFHREIVLPDVMRIVEDAVGASERRTHGRLDAIFHKLDKLETEYQFLKVAVSRVEDRMTALETRMDALETQHRDLLAGLHRLEERLARVERNVDDLVTAQDKEPLRAEVADLRARVDDLQAQVRVLAERVDRR